MKKSQTAVLFIAILLASLLVACGQKTEGGTDQISLVPETANMIGHVQLGQIMGDADIAETYAALPKQVGDPQTIEEALAKAMDMTNLDLSDFEEAWVFGEMSQPTGDMDYFGAILKGSFEESSLLASVRTTASDCAERCSAGTAAASACRADMAPHRQSWCP